MGWHVPFELVLLCLLLELGQERCDDLRVLRGLTERREVVGRDRLSSNAGDERRELYGVRDRNADKVRLERVAVDVELRYKGAATVNALDVLEGDVLSLSQFHDVLRHRSVL